MENYFPIVISSTMVVVRLSKRNGAKCSKFEQHTVGSLQLVGQATTHRSIETAGAIGSSHYRKAEWRSGYTRYQHPHELLRWGDPTLSGIRATICMPRHREMCHDIGKKASKRQYIPHDNRSAEYHATGARTLLGINTSTHRCARVGPTA
jgi:hypothetical protein